MKSLSDYTIQEFKKLPYNERCELILQSDEITWTAGSGLSYGQAVSQWWSDEIGNRPTERDLKRLKNYILKLKYFIEDENSHHKKITYDKFQGLEIELESVELMELYKEAFNSLTELQTKIEKRLSESDVRKEPTNEMGKKMIEEGKEYEPTRKEVRRQACIEIEESEEHLSYFKAKSEKHPANSKLYNPVLKHFEKIGNPISKGTVRKYLDSGIREGILQEMLKERKKNQN